MRQRVNLGNVMLYVDFKGRKTITTRLIQPHRCVKPKHVPSATGAYQYLTLIELQDYYACRNAKWHYRVLDRVGRLKHLRRHDIKTVWTSNVTWKLQRLQRGWSDRDAWNIDTHIACTLEQMLKHHRDTAVTFVDINAQGERCTNDDHLDPDQGCNSSERWNQLLDEMILGFGYSCDSDSEPEWNNRQAHTAWASAIDRAHELYAKWHSSLWD